MALFRMDYASRHRAMLRRMRDRAASFAVPASERIPDVTSRSAPEPAHPPPLPPPPPPSPSIPPPPPPSSIPQAFVLVMAKKVEVAGMGSKVGWWCGLKADQFQLQPDQVDGIRIVFRSAVVTEKMRDLLASGKLSVA